MISFIGSYNTHSLDNRKLTASHILTRLLVTGQLASSLEVCTTVTFVDSVQLMSLHMLFPITLAYEHIVTHLEMNVAYKHDILLYSTLLYSLIA